MTKLGYQLYAYAGLRRDSTLRYNFLILFLFISDSTKHHPKRTVSDEIVT